MNQVVVHRETCRLCGGTRLELVYELSPSPIGDDYVSADRLEEVQDTYPIRMYLCHDCGLSQLLDVIDPEILYGNYLYASSSSPGLGQHFRSYAEDLVARIRPAAGSLIVDIGSNDGMLLRQFQQLGMNVLGVDPAQEIAQKATTEGIETIPNFFTPALAGKIRYSHGPASVVTANNVFANIDDLTTLTEGIRKLLAPDGVFVFESFYLADLIKNMVFDFIYHEHLSAFSATPLQRFFARMGMELIDIQRVPTKGGSLRYTVQLAGGPRHVDRSVNTMVESEIKAGLFQAVTFRNFMGRIDALKSQTSSLLRSIKAEGQSVAGFGASITATTLIYHFGIGSYIDYLGDDNPAKQGRYSPGLHLPVFAPKALYERKPDHVVVLAWRFAGQILDKHKDLRAGGTRFILPVPEVKVI